MRKTITSNHNRLAHKIKAAFGIDWKTAFGWARLASSDDSIYWTQRPDSVFGRWCLPTLDSVYTHMKALSDGYSIVGDHWRARTFKRFADLLNIKRKAGCGVNFQEVLMLQGVGEGVLQEVLDFYRAASDADAQNTTPRARHLALQINARIQAGYGDRVWQTITRDALMRNAYWRHLAVYGGGLTGGAF